MAAKNAEEVYTEVVRRLPLKERLRLAALILNGVVPALTPTGVNENEAWSEEDLRELTLASLWYATHTNEEG